MAINLLILLIAAFGIAVIIVIDSARGKTSDRPWCRMFDDKAAFTG